MPVMQLAGCLSERGTNTGTVTVTPAPVGLTRLDSAAAWQHSVLPAAAGHSVWRELTQ